jgi:hypothetical protein
MDLDLPFKTFADLEAQGLELQVTCQRCRRRTLIEITPELRERSVIGRRFRCKGSWYDGTPEALVCRPSRSSGLGLGARRITPVDLLRRQSHKKAAMEVGNEGTNAAPTDAGGHTLASPAWADRWILVVRRSYAWPRSRLDLLRPLRPALVDRQRELRRMALAPLSQLSWQRSLPLPCVWPAPPDAYSSR